MSAVTSLPTGARRADPATRAPSARTLVGVELRKMVDTKVGRWMLIGLAVVTVATFAVVLATTERDRSFVNLFAIAQVPLSILLPLLGALAATSEWGQRTVLTTFALVPSRGRVLQSKLAAALLIALVTTPLTLAAAALAALFAPLFGTTTADWGLGISDIGEALAYQQLSMLWGFALGVLLLNSAAAMVLYFVLPMAWHGLSGSISSLAEIQPWLDSGVSWSLLFEPDVVMSATNWAQVGVTAIVWVILPLAIGTFRVLRKEVD